MKMIKNSVFKIFKRAEKFRFQQRGSWFSVGFKLMIGVGMICVFCMGLLIVINYQAFAQVSIETNALLEVNAVMNKDLRANIFNLQKKYLAIPKLLQVNADEDIKTWLQNNYIIEKQSIIRDRYNFKQFFNRSQRRDISKGYFVVQPDADRVIISKGQLDEQGNFLDAIEQISIKSNATRQDVQDISNYISTAILHAGSADALKQKVSALNSFLVDEAIASEKARNAILYQVENIENKKDHLIQSRQKKQQMTGFIAVLTILLNLILLHFMTWFVVEKPLKRLTRSIDRINTGEIVTIPYQNRKDRIGVLSGVLSYFQEVLIRLQNEDQRKKKERTIIQDLIEKMSGTIEVIQAQAHTMKNSAIELSSLAAMTETQTDTATESASKTVEQTDKVCVSTRQLQTAVSNISNQVSRQNELVNDINSVTLSSRQDIERLTDASQKISDIVKIVKYIAKESNLLALNARIEAARAGEAGKGFTVVANEVRDLSNQTRTANEDISDKVMAIQTASQVIVEHTQRIETRVERLTQTSRRIALTIEEQSIVTSGIALNAHATTQDIKDVSSRIVKVRQAAKSTRQFAGDVLSYSEQIEARLSDLLNETREKLSRVGLSETGEVETGFLSELSNKKMAPFNETNARLLTQKLYQKKSSAGRNAA